LDTLATALYVRTDDLLKASPERAPWRPKIGIAPRISDAELICECRCGAPGWRTTRLGVGDPM